MNVRIVPGGCFDSRHSYERGFLLDIEVLNAGSPRGLEDWPIVDVSSTENRPLEDIL